MALRFLCFFIFPPNFVRGGKVYCIMPENQQSDRQPSLEEEKGVELMDDVPKDVDQDVQKVGALDSGDGVINAVAEDTLQSDVTNLEQCKEENAAPTDVTNICESAEEGEEAIALQNHLDKAAATEEPISAEEPPKHKKRSSLGKALHSAKKRLSMPFHSHQVPSSIEASVGEESTKMSLSTTNEETDAAISEVPNNLVGAEEKIMSLVNEQEETDQSNQLNDEQLQLIGLSDEVQGKEDMTLTDQVKVEEVEVQKEEPQDTETVTEDATCPDESKYESGELSGLDDFLIADTRLHLPVRAWQNFLLPASKIFQAVPSC